MEPKKSKPNKTKQSVMDAACQLFFAKGYHGTSVRDIAKRAGVNVSLINYYFTSKQGLLEEAVVFYYEAYIKQLEDILTLHKENKPVQILKKLIETIIQYKQNNYQFTCFIQRELTFDSVFVREMMVTYLAKENYLISKLFHDVLADTNHSQIEREFLLLQLKGMLNTPYVAPNEWRNQVISDQSHDFFVMKYTKTIHHWLDYLTTEQQKQ